MQRAFAEDWTFTTGEVLAGDAWYPSREEHGFGVARGIASGPDEDLEKLRKPDVRHDAAETERRLAVAHELFDGVLDVRPDGDGVARAIALALTDAEARRTGPGLAELQAAGMHVVDSTTLTERWLELER